MNAGHTLFAQFMQHLPRDEFRRSVERYRGNRKVHSFTCMDQFLAMAFAQLTHRESLRDIETCLRSAKNKLYHMGFRGQVSRNTLANANERRDWRIYADLGRALIAIARRLYAGDEFDAQLGMAVYALDSTTIDLCLSIFPWAGFRRAKGAVKAHTLLNVNSELPLDLIITTGKVHDVNILDRIEPETLAIYLMDRAYCDFARLFRIGQAGAYFIVRAKKNLAFRRLYSQRPDKASGVQCDQTIRLKNFQAAKNYPAQLRRVRYYDSETHKRLVFLTNHFELPAADVARLYRNRWKIELFFKWIKQRLRVKKFYGRNENAVKTQIWIAVSVYLLVAIMKKRLNLPQSLYTILQVMSVQIFEKTPILQALGDSSYENDNEPFSEQLNLGSL